MQAIDARARTLLMWFVPFAAIALAIGFETDWGRALTPMPVMAPVVQPQPVSTALLPEYRLDGGVDARRETIERTLFNPTRRAAPAAPQVNTAKPAMTKGQFVLTGTTVIGDKATAFLREVNGGKARRVAKGESVNGMMVAEVAPDRVRLTLGDDSEELTLRVAAGPRSTVQPVVIAPPAQGQPGGLVPPRTQAATPAAPVVQDVADVLAERRRAARAAEAAAAGAVPPPPAPPVQRATPAATPPAGTPQPDPAWNDVYRRYMQPRK